LPPLSLAMDAACGQPPAFNEAVEHHGKAENGAAKVSRSPATYETTLMPPD